MGGKGQLGVAVEVFRELNITEVDLIGLAKMRTERDPFAEEVAHSAERVFLPGRKNPIVLRPNSTALFLCNGYADEAHRFAITYHRQLRAKERLSSPLDSVPGVGPGRRKLLLRHFGSIKAFSSNSRGVAQVPGMTKTTAEAVHHWSTQSIKQSHQDSSIADTNFRNDQNPSSSSSLLSSTFPSRFRHGRLFLLLSACLGGQVSATWDWFSLSSWWAVGARYSMFLAW